MTKARSNRAKAEKPDKLAKLEMAYLEAMDEHYAFVPLSGLNIAQRRALQRIAERTGAAAETVIVLLVREWVQIAAVIKRASDADWKIPVPSLCAVAKNIEEILGWMKGAGFMILDNVPSGKARRAAERFDPPLQPYNADEDDEDGDGEITIGGDTPDQAAA
jgi:hypothetical protein